MNFLLIMHSLNLEALCSCCTMHYMGSLYELIKCVYACMIICTFEIPVEIEMLIYLWITIIVALFHPSGIVAVLTACRTSFTKLSPRPLYP